MEKLRTGPICPELNKKLLQKFADESACLQRIQMIVWDYMETPKGERSGSDMANEIFEDVKKTLNKNK